MIRETTTNLSPRAVIEEARQFFSDEGAFHSATIIEEGDTFITLGMFRSRLVIKAYPAEDGGRTTVRVSTLRRNDVVGRFMAFIETGGSAGNTGHSEARGSPSGDASAETA